MNAACLTIFCAPDPPGGRTFATGAQGLNLAVQPAGPTPAARNARALGTELLLPPYRPGGSDELSCGGTTLFFRDLQFWASVPIKTLANPAPPPHQSSPRVTKPADASNETQRPGHTRDSAKETPETPGPKGRPSRANATRRREGARGAALSTGVEGAISSGCGAAFASHETPGADGASFSNVAAFFGATCCRVGAEDDDEVFEQDDDEPADERVEVDVDDDDDDLPPWTAGDAEVMRGALDALDGDERALCAPGLWMRHGDGARSAAVRAVLEAKPAIAAAIDAGDPHAVTDAVAALLRERAPLATLGRRKAFIRAATEPSPSRGVAGQRHHLCILLGELPPFHREVLTRLAKHLGKIVRRRRLNGASWRGLAAATAPLIFGHGVAADADEALWATVACARLLRTVNAAAGGPKSPTPSPPTSPASTAAASPVSPSPSPRDPSPVATPVATPRSIEPSSPEPAATPPRSAPEPPTTPPSPEPVSTPPKPKPAPIVPPEPAPTPATVTPSRGERSCVVVRAFVATSPNELSVNEGDVVLVPAADLAKFGSLVYARKTDGSDREGYVPHKFVREGSRR